MAALVGGGGLLALVGGSYLRRQRAVAKAAHAAAAATDSPATDSPAPARSSAVAKAAER
jgi:hypothetical protein